MKTAIKTVTVLKYYVNTELRLYTKVFYKSGREKTYFGLQIPKTIIRFKECNDPAKCIQYDDHVWYIYGEDKLK